ncbi:hypothetical protein [Wolbachia endosymbiont of Ctenocephalides felis wCfeJ]|uniref:hypothetical protein n=1 Tax=Wolbachia endosymbiont of Ctenocephalides felis wCfeJ TaxID=2732594 RepID=UPI001447C082|nr:hypothetical protein [Wolbachia endosymbiont of Ctenocephalides felis wCfeJ]WCR58014.1 MAG: hypothetical protein PG980_000486 [Wolbachia endosymbiont of Ctenocephalides felis wCfeJ]
MTKRSKNASRREEMTPFEGRATVTIFSSLEDIEKGRKIYFSLKGKGLTIDYLSISDNSFSLYFTNGITKEVPTPEGYCRLMINNIISDLRSGRIKSKTEYDFRKFDERYLKGLKKLLSQETTTTSLQEESTTEAVDYETKAIRAASTIGSTTTELFNSSQLKESATEELDYEVQEDSEYFAVEPAPLKQQKLDLAPDETTEEIKHIMEEIKSSNTSHGITTENIEYIQDMTRDVTFSPGKVTSRNVPAFSELSSTNATLPQLPNESGIIGTTVEGLSTLSAYIIAPVLLVAAVTVGGCWFLHKKKREDSYDVEKAGVENEVEAPFSEEQNSLLDEINIKSGVYKSFQRNVD